VELEAVAAWVAMASAVAVAVVATVDPLACNE
jgi:hypothetical protein